MSESCNCETREGCWRCCPTCNVDMHRCPGCGTNVQHHETACIECLAEIRRQEFYVVR